MKVTEHQIMKTVSDAAFSVIWSCYAAGHEDMGRNSLRAWMRAKLSKTLPEFVSPAPAYRIGLNRWKL